jgi:hypothetical protein
LNTINVSLLINPEDLPINCPLIFFHEKSSSFISATIEPNETNNINYFFVETNGVYHQMMNNRNIDKSNIIQYIRGIKMDDDQTFNDKGYSGSSVGIRYGLDNKKFSIVGIISSSYPDQTTQDYNRSFIVNVSKKIEWLSSFNIEFNTSRYNTVTKKIEDIDEVITISPPPPTPPQPTPTPPTPLPRQPHEELEELIKKSDEFNGRFPAPHQKMTKPIGNTVKTYRENVLPITQTTNTEYNQDIIKFMNNTFPIIHEKVRTLFNDFILYVNGDTLNPLHKLYKKETMTVDKLITRLLVKRPVVCYNAGDKGYLDRSGLYLSAIANNNNVQEYINYQERMLSSFISVSVPSYFINDGNRFNNGVIAKYGSYEPYGVYVA